MANSKIASCWKQTPVQGLYWSSDDVVLESSFYMPSCTWSASAKQVPDKRDARHYLLMVSSPKHQWSSFLVVTAKCGRMDILSRFRISDLSVENTTSCCATTPNGQVVYKYSSSSPEKRTNTLYDEDTPLEGLWPWPKSHNQKGDSKLARDDDEEESRTSDDLFSCDRTDTLCSELI